MHEIRLHVCIESYEASEFWGKENIVAGIPSNYLKYIFSPGIYILSSIVPYQLKWDV